MGLEPTTFRLSVGLFVGSFCESAFLLDLNQACPVRVKRACPCGLPRGSWTRTNAPPLREEVPVCKLTLSEYRAGCREIFLGRASRKSGENSLSPLATQPHLQRRWRDSNSRNFRNRSQSFVSSFCKSASQGYQIARWTLAVLSESLPCTSQESLSLRTY